MNSEHEIEEAIGLFDIAISHSSDCDRLSGVLADFSEAYGLQCYTYLKYQRLQMGLNINDIMHFVYSKTPRIIILNSPAYRTTPATKLEYEILADRTNQLEIAILSKGGPDLNMESSKVVSQFEIVTDFDLITLFKKWRRN